MKIPLEEIVSVAKFKSVTRQCGVRLVTGFLVAFMFVSTISCQLNLLGRTNPDNLRVRDKLYIWTHPVGSHDGYYLAPHTFVKSTMTPVEGARYLDVPNLYFIQYGDKPPLSEYRKTAISFRPMREVIWSLTGLSGKTSEQMRNHVLELAAEFENISGFILDDFFKWGEQRRHEKIPHWVAENEVAFPVTLTLIPPQPTACDKIELVQTQWPTEDYRTKDFVIEVTRDEIESQLATGSLANVAGAVAAIELPGHEIEKLRIRILSTHDTDKAKSCGLKEVRLFNKGRKLDTEGWNATASSTYPTSAHAPEFVFMTQWPPEPEHPAAAFSPSSPVAAVMTPCQLLALRAKTVIGGKRLPIICGIYENQISPRIMPHIQHVDKVALWTWVASDLAYLEENFEKLERLIAPKPIILGCYLFDYGGNHPMSVEQMQHQCELGIKWLFEGRIDGMIFLASNICDQGLQTVEWTKKWIAEVGDDPLPVR